MEGKEFLSLLTKFPNLMHLKMSNVFITNDITGHDIADACPKVVGMKILDGNTPIINQLPAILASRLKYLTLRQDTVNAFVYDNITFSKLEELNMCWPSSELSAGILKSASHLKKISIAYWTDWMKNDEIQNSIVNFVTNNTSLNHMGFSIDSSHFCSVLEGIEHGLFKTKKQHRKQLKIHILVRNTDFQPRDFTFNLARFVNSLETRDINDFMVIWEFVHRNDDETKSILFD
eukprot:271207_1